MGTKTYNNYEDLLTFTRASEGYALRPVSYGTELVTNGNFDTDSDWIKSAGSTIANGVLTQTIVSGGYESTRQLYEFEQGSIYVLTATVNGTSGKNMRFRDDAQNLGGLRYDTSDGATNGRVIMNGSDQNVRFIFQARAGSDRILIERDSTSGDFSYTVDNVSLKKVTFDESDGTLTLFKHTNNVPRVEYDGSGNRLGLLVEEARTNLLKYSEDQTAVNWGNINVQNQTSPSATGPDGAQTATEIIANDQSGNPLGDDYQAYVPYASITTTANTDYTISVFVKRPSGANAPSYLYINHDVGINGGVWFDLVNGTVATERSGFTGVIEDKGNGWYRCACSFNSGSDTFMQANFFFTENDASQLMSCLGQSLGFLYGAQFEEGSFATSYIKTTGSTATRSADVASINTADFGFNTLEGCVVCDVSITFNTSVSSYPNFWQLGHDDNLYERITHYVSTSGDQIAYEIRTDNVTQAGGTIKSSVGGSYSGKLALTWKKDSVAATEDGDTPVTDSSASIAPNEVRNKLSFGSSTTGGSHMVGHIKSFKYYPRRLTDEQIKDLTS